MIFFIFVVAVILLVDLSGRNLTKEIRPLIYIIPEDDKKKPDTTVTLSEDATPEAIAKQAEDRIFGEKQGEKNEKKTK